MKTLGEVLRLSIEYLKEHQISSPRRQAEDLLAEIFGFKRIQLYLQFDRPLEEQELDVCRKALFRRGQGEPLDYILGKKSFFHCEFELNSSVLIPRQETEIFLEKITQEIGKNDFENRIAWDICCGSGCLGISLKKIFPALQVTLSDLSREALQVAKKNGKRNHVEVMFLEGDLLSPFRGQKADFVLCNPPYISEVEYENLDREVKLFEPKLALVSGSSGVEFYERLSEELPEYLNPGAKVFLEIGSGQGEKVISIFSLPCWKNKKVEKDWAGHDRFFFLEFQ